MTDSLMKDENIRIIFGSKKVGKRLSAAIIADVLQKDEKEVLNHLEFVNSYIPISNQTVHSMADTVLENDKIIVNIEFNYTYGSDTKVKNESYVMQLYLTELRTHEDYQKIKPVIQIQIDNYDYFKAGKFVYTSLLMEKDLHLIESENVQIYHLNLYYLRQNGYNIKEERYQKLAKMLYIFICEDEKKIDSLFKGDKLMEDVKKEMRRATDGLDWSMLYYNQEEIDRHNIEEAKRIATAEGLAEGLSKGEKKHTLQVLKNMLDDNLSYDMIKKYLDLSQEQLDSLLKEIQ